jgi:MbtH protein
MKKMPVTNWLAALGIGGSFVLPADATAQGPPQERPRAEAADRDGTYVVINHEEQYSVWPARLRAPAGWTPVAPREPMEGTVDRLAQRAEHLRFLVVINHEEQYSIWPLEYEVPKGFEPISDECALEDCVKLLERRRR